MNKIYIVYAHWYELDYDDQTRIDAVYADEALAKKHIENVRKHWEGTKGDRIGTFGEMTLSNEDESCVRIGNDFEEISVYYEAKDILNAVKYSDTIKEDL